MTPSPAWTLLDGVQWDRQSVVFGRYHQLYVDELAWRWIAAKCQILLFDEPTRGIDIGAKAEIYSLIERLAAEGKSIVVVSSELPEIIRLADRVLVMRQGRIAAQLEREDLSEQTIVAHAVPQTSASN